MNNNFHYKSNLNDIFFNLFDFFKIQDNILTNKKYSHIDKNIIKEMLNNINILAKEKIANSFVDGDRTELKLNNGTVMLPTSIKKSMDAYYEGNWNLLNIPQNLGGIEAPNSLNWAAFEMIVGANPSVALYLFGSIVVNLINECGTEKQKNIFIKKMIQDKWGATMVLTESESGSDVGAGKTQAIHIKDDIYHIKGTKRFITNGDYNNTKNIIHMVLARPKNAIQGIKGLSLFIVPKIWINEDLTYGKRNGVFCTNIEKKMGIHASATCELTFGAKTPAKGFLLGNIHNGIKQMFKLIEQARMAVGIKSMSTLSTAYLNALAFTKERIQGIDLTSIFNKTVNKVNIIKHPDIRRMLMMQKSYAEGMRVLCMYCNHIHDLQIIETDITKSTQYKKILNLLLPLIKGYNSEESYHILNMSLQCFGGSGYLSDYPIEQYIRDQKIDSLYEGTTHIQSLDLLFRKIIKDNKHAFNIIINNIQHTYNNKIFKDHLSIEYKILQNAHNCILEIFNIITNQIGESLYYAGLHANNILKSLSELIIGWLLIKQGETSCALLKNNKCKHTPFYQGKIFSAQFYCRNVLPNINCIKNIILNNNLDIMNLSDNSF